MSLNDRMQIRKDGMKGIRTQDRKEKQRRKQGRKGRNKFF